MADTTIIHPASLSRQSLKGDPAHIFDPHGAPAALGR